MNKRQPVILVLDDDDIYREFLKGIFEREGYRVEHFCYKADGLRWLEANKPDIIISDMNSPQVRGIEFIQILRENPITRDTKVIIVSGNMSAEDAMTVMKLGAIDCLTKPVDEGELMEIVERVFGEQDLQ
jgi:DNA-binding NtrC family response regulator